MALEAKDQAEKRSQELAGVNGKLRHLSYLSDMNLAHAAWDQNNPTLAGELLERYLPKQGEADLRGFEWRYLRRQQHREQMTLTGHDGFVSALDWTPDGRRLLTFGFPRPGIDRSFRDWFATARTEVKLWDLASGKELPLRLDRATDIVFSGRLSADGKWLAAGCRDKSVRIWDLETGKLIANMEGQTFENVGQVAFSPDKRFLASRTLSLDSNRDRCEIKIWDLMTFKIITSLVTIMTPVVPVFSPNGKRVACGGDVSLVKIWETESGREILSQDLKKPISSVAFSPDGNRLAVAGGTGTLQILEASTGNVEKTFPVGASPSRLIFSPDGKRLTVSSDAGLVVWDVESGQMVQTFKGQGIITCVAFSPDGKSLASGGFDGSVRIWNAGSDNETIRISAASAIHNTVVLSPDGGIAMTGINDDTIRLWNAATGERLGPPLKLENKCVNWDFARDGEQVVLTDADRNVTVWEVATGARIRAFKHEGSKGFVKTSVSSDGNWFACQERGTSLQLWDLKTGTRVRTFQGLADAPVYCFSDDSGRLAMVDRSGVVKIWNLATGQESALASFKNRIVWMAFIRGANRLAVCCSPENVFTVLASELHIVDVESGKEVTPPLKGLTISLGVSFSPDGTRLATGGVDGSVKIRDLASGQETLTLKGHMTEVTGLAFSPDGHRLISASSDMTIRVWDATPLPEDTHRSVGP